MADKHDLEVNIVVKADASGAKNAGKDVDTLKQKLQKLQSGYDDAKKQLEGLDPKDPEFKKKAAQLRGKMGGLKKAMGNFLKENGDLLDQVANDAKKQADDAKKATQQRKQAAKPAQQGKAAQQAKPEPEAKKQQDKDNKATSTGKDSDKKEEGLGEMWARQQAESQKLFKAKTEAEAELRRARGKQAKAEAQAKLDKANADFTEMGKRHAAENKAYNDAHPEPKKSATPSQPPQPQGQQGAGAQNQQGTPGAQGQKGKPGAAPAMMQFDESEESEADRKKRIRSSISLQRQYLREQKQAEQQEEQQRKSQLRSSVSLQKQRAREEEQQGREEEQAQTKRIRVSLSLQRQYLREQEKQDKESLDGMFKRINAQGRADKQAEADQNKQLRADIQRKKQAQAQDERDGKTLDRMVGKILAPLTQNQELERKMDQAAKFRRDYLSGSDDYKMARLVATREQDLIKQRLNNALDEGDHSTARKMIKREEELNNKYHLQSDMSAFAYYGAGLLLGKVANWGGKMYQQPMQAFLQNNQQYTQDFNLERAQVANNQAQIDLGRKMSGWEQFKNRFGTAMYGMPGAEAVGIGLDIGGMVGPAAADTITTLALMKSSGMSPGKMIGGAFKGLGEFGKALIPFGIGGGAAGGGIMATLGGLVSPVLTGMALGTGVASIINMAQGKNGNPIDMWKGVIDAKGQGYEMTDQAVVKEQFAKFSKQDQQAFRSYTEQLTKLGDDIIEIRKKPILDDDDKKLINKLTSQYIDMMEKSGGTKLTDDQKKQLYDLARPNIDQLQGQMEAVRDAVGGASQKDKQYLASFMESPQGKIMKQQWQNQRTDFNIEQANQKFDVNRNYIRTLEDINKQRTRIEEDYQIESKRLARQRQWVEEDTAHAIEDVNRKLQRVQRDSAISLQRLEEDTTRQRKYIQEDYYRTQTRALEDYTRTQTRLMQDYNKSMYRLDYTAAKDTTRLNQDTYKSLTRLDEDTQRDRLRSQQDFQLQSQQAQIQYSRSMQDLNKNFQDTVLGIMAPGIASSPVYQLMKAMRDYQTQRGRIQQDKSLQDYQNNLQYSRQKEDINRTEKRGLQDIGQSYQRGNEDIGQSYQWGTQDAQQAFQRGNEDNQRQFDRTNEDNQRQYDRAMLDLSINEMRQRADILKNLADATVDAMVALRDIAIQHARAIQQLDDAQADLDRNHKRSLEDLDTAQNRAAQDYETSMNRIDQAAQKFERDMDQSLNAFMVELVAQEKINWMDLKTFKDSIGMPAGQGSAAGGDNSGSGSGTGDNSNSGEAVGTGDFSQDGSTDPNAGANAGPGADFGSNESVGTGDFSNGNSSGNSNNDQNTNPNGYAVGLNVVPYDNFLARLHQGEMVVPEHDASLLRDAGYNPVGGNISPYLSTPGMALSGGGSAYAGSSGGRATYSTGGNSSLDQMLAKYYQDRSNQVTADQYKQVTIDAVRQGVQAGLNVGGTLMIGGQNGFQYQGSTPVMPGSNRRPAPLGIGGSYYAGPTGGGDAYRPPTAGNGPNFNMNLHFNGVGGDTEGKVRAFGNQIGTYIQTKLKGIL